jgi:hypothetical protein
MKLDIGTFSVIDIVFGGETSFADGVVTVNRDALVKEILQDDRLTAANIEIAKPGESVRIWPVRDTIEPRVKVSGGGVPYPAVCGRDVEVVGSGRTHRLAGMAVLDVAQLVWHDQGSDYLDVFIDMSGPWAEWTPQACLLNLCVVTEPDRSLGIDEQNAAVHGAALMVSDRIAEAVRDLEPESVETFELGEVDPDLPKVYYIQFLHSPFGKSRSLHTFHTSVYGYSNLVPPWLLHPNEVLDGAISGPYRTVFAVSWMLVNNPVLKDLYDRHGKDINFCGVVACKTEWTTQREKSLMAAQTAKLLEMWGAEGVLMTWDASGNEYLEVVYTLRECEKRGIKTVLLTTEEEPTGGVPTLLEPAVEADAIVSSGYRAADLMGLTKVPPVDRVIGEQVRTIWRNPDGVVVTGSQPLNEEIDAPWRYDDHYGFNRHSVVAY